MAFNLNHSDWCKMVSQSRMQIHPYLAPCMKIKSKLIKYLNLNLTTLNLIEEKVGRSLQCMGTGDHSLNITQVAQTPRATRNKWDLLKLRSFCKANDTVNKTKVSLLMVKDLHQPYIRQRIDIQNTEFG